RANLCAMIRGYIMLFREIRLLTFLILFITVPSDGHTATISMRLLYPSFAASWATTWIAKEAGYFATEGLEKGKKAGITTFGSTSDQVIRLALRQFGLEPNKDVALLSFGAQPEAFAALQSGAIQAAPLSYPLYAVAAKLGMRKLVKISDLGFEDINGTVITTKSFLSQQRDTALRFMRGFIRGMQRYRTDKEFSKRVLGKYGKITDDELLEGAWQDYAPTIQKNPRPSLKAIQFLIENQFRDKTPLPKPETFVDASLVDQLEKSGFIDSVN